MAGVFVGCSTVSLATAEVTLPPEPLTITRKLVPLAHFVALAVYFAFFAPEMVFHFLPDGASRCHL